MNPTAVRLISALIPSRKARHAFRDRHLQPRRPDAPAKGVPAELDKRIRGLEAQLATLSRLVFLKEFYPDFAKSLCADFPATDAVLAQLVGHTWANSGNGAAVKKQLIGEQISLATAMIHILPDEALFGIFRRLLSFCAIGDAHYKTLCGHWNWLLWRTGRHEENLHLMEEFFPAGTEIPPHIFRRFIASAESSGRHERAQEMMREYHKKFLTKELWKNYVTARLSAELGMRDKEIDFVCGFVARIVEAQERGLFAERLRGKRIAVVGNGPQEVGRGNGEKIDACDVVIRFNDFSGTPEFRKDYGSKTDIWVRSLWVDARNRSRLSDVVVGDALHSEYPNLKILREVEEMNPERVYAIPAEVYYRVHAAGINHPTNGTLMLAWIKEVRPDFSADDCYGFSFKAETAPKALTHYYDSPDLQKGTAHNLDKERAFLRGLFGLQGD